MPPQLLPRGRGGLFVVGELLRDLEERTGLGLVLVKERGEADEHVQRKAFRVSTGDDQTPLRAHVVPVGNELGAGDGRCASAVAVHFLGVPVDIVTDALLAGFPEVFGLDDDMLIHRYEILALNYKLGHGNFSCWILPAPRPLPTSVSKGRDGQTAPKGFRPSSARRSLQAASSFM